MRSPAAGTRRSDSRGGSVLPSERCRNPALSGVVGCQLQADRDGSCARMTNATGDPVAGNTYALYGRPNAGSLAPQIVLEEIGAPYEMVWVSKATADVETLQRVNPTGKVPALVLPDGTAIFESAAILI